MDNLNRVLGQQRRAAYLTPGQHVGTARRIARLVMLCWSRGRSVYRALTTINYHICYHLLNIQGVGDMYPGTGKT